MCLCATSWVPTPIQKMVLDISIKFSVKCDVFIHTHFYKLSSRVLVRIYFFLFTFAVHKTLEGEIAILWWVFRCVLGLVVDGSTFSFVSSVDPAHGKIFSIEKLLLLLVTTSIIISLFPF